MTSEEIRDISIDSAKAYYQYLDENDKGEQEIEVFEISYSESKDLILRLRLSQKLFDTEAIFFKNLKNNEKYDTGSVKVIEYDNDKNILLIKPTENIATNFKKLRNTDLKVVSDLKFLVQRVITWYELNGANVHLPKDSSKYREKFNEIKFFPERSYQPSDNQKDSLRNIFTNPFSYVWGAPGTGKTQFVLSYAVLQYIANKDKIAILAPTNNAIEQVLRGVLRMTDKAGVNRKQIIRLGTPSKKFAEEYPEVCEEKGVQKNLSEIDKQIGILERILAHEQANNKLKELENGLLLFDAFPKLIERINSNKKNYDTELSKLIKKEIDINYENNELKKLTNEKTKEINKLKSLGHKLTKLFSSKQTSTEKKIIEIEKLIKNKTKEVEYYKHELSEIHNSVTEKKNELNKSTNQFLNETVKLKLLYDQHENTSSIINDIDFKNWENKRTAVETTIGSMREKVEVDSHLFEEYKQTPIEHIQATLSRHLTAREKLAAFSTEERLKTVNVIACTLDGYIGRYAESKLNVSHIFLDEAGYANIIKSLTLFNHSVPISFLGDHMQLPPVCEINDMDIQRNETYKNMFLWAQSAIHLDSIFKNSRDICLSQYLSNSPFTPHKIAKTSLTSTYRFGNNLAKILAKYVYEGNFNSSNPNGETQIHFIHAQKNEGIKSRVSINEVQAIKNMIDDLKRLNQNDFVILTPYKKQIMLLNKHLPQERNELKILTVHGSQGREWDTVILSVVDTSDKWFVDSTIPLSKGLNLVNTAVSRAKKNLIIVCDKNYWLNQNGQLITDLIKNGTEYGN